MNDAPQRAIAPLAGLAVVATALFGLTGCPNTNLITNRPTIEDAEDQVTSCKVAKDPLNPMIIEWPAINRSQLQSKSADGVVVVSYVGCHLKILTGCDASGGYDFRGVQAARDKVRMANESELNAKLPLGFIDLKAKLAGGNALELDYVAVGERVASRPPAALSGSCEGATHYVRAMTMGAFSLDTVATGEVGAEVGVGDIGGGISRKEERKNVNHQGDVESCASQRGAMSESEARDNECGAILQLSLQPLRQVGSGDIVSGNFGVNIGPMGDVPTVPDTKFSILQSSLRDVDDEFMDRLEAATRAEKDTTSSPQSKSDKWSAVCSYEGKNNIKETACKRRDEWQAVAEAQAKREQQIQDIRNQYFSDKAKLDKLLKRDEDIVSAEQKKAYQAEFEQIYAPYREIIDSAPSSAGTAGSGDSTSGDATATTSPPSALAGTLVAMDLGVGYMFNRLQKDLDSQKVFGPYTFGTTGLLEGESGAELRVRLGLQATEGLFVYGLFRYGFLPDWKPFTVGAGLAYRPAIESIIPEIGFDMGYFKASSLSFATIPESNMSLGGYSIGLHMGVHYLVVPFMSVGVLGGLQGLALSRAALEGSDLPSECTGTPPPSYCSDLGTSQSTSGIVGYGEANMAFHF